MKIKSIDSKEIIAWIVFVCAAVLFSFTAALAQDKKSDSKSTIHIKIEKNEDGKKTKIDTTVTKDQLPQLKEYLKDSGIDFESDDHGFSFDQDFSTPGGSKVIIRNHSKMSKEEREEFKKEMKKLHKDMDKMKDDIMKDIHIEIYGDDGNDHDNFDFNMTVPHVYLYKDGDDEKGSKHHSYSYSYSFNDDVPDSLNDGRHIIVRGKEGETKPEFEKEIVGKNGEKIFVFKRNIPEKSEKARASVGINRVKVYPNPSDGKISVSFRAIPKGDVTISVTDANGKEVFTDKQNDFSGEYFNQIDISGKGKGAYFVKITQGDDSITKKIMVE